MKNINDQMLEVIRNAIVTVPGVANFANYQKLNSAHFETENLIEAIEEVNVENIERITIHLILLNGVNIRDVVNEVQIRVKYELERLSDFKQLYTVDIVIEDLLN